MKKLFVSILFVLVSIPAYAGINITKTNPSPTAAPAPTALPTQMQSVPLAVSGGGTGVTSMTSTVGGILTTGISGTGPIGVLPDVAFGSIVASGGTGGAPSYTAVQTCTSSAAVTCTITVTRSGCNPICSQTTSVSTELTKAAVSGTTLTCTWPTSGTNTCNCICP